MAGKQNPIRVGLVGAGDNTRRKHIPGLLAQEGVELVAVANRRRESSERVARDYGIARVHDHWREVVDADDLDAIVIGTWPYLHCPVTLAALATGKHVLTEARMAMNLAEAEMMLAASREAPHLVTQIVTGGAALHADATIRRLIADGYLGDIVAVEVRQLYGYIDREAPYHWRHNREYSGLNIMRMGILYEDVLYWVGPAVRLAALGRTFVKLRTDDEGVPRADQHSRSCGHHRGVGVWRAAPHAVLGGHRARHIGDHDSRHRGDLASRERPIARRQARDDEEITAHSHCRPPRPRLVRHHTHPAGMWKRSSSRRSAARVLSPARGSRRACSTWRSPRPSTVVCGRGARWRCDARAPAAGWT